MPIASTVSAAPKITKSYRYSNGIIANQDAACIDAVVNYLLVDFDGVAEIRLGSNSIFETARGHLATYAGAEFRSEYGNTNGTINCLFSANGSTVTDVTITFEGRGLTGYKGKASFTGNPAQETKTAVSRTLTP